MTDDRVTRRDTLNDEWDCRYRLLGTIGTKPMTDQATAEQVTENLKWALVRAYCKGAQDVHDNYEEDRDPDFKEAGCDYAASVIDDLQSAAPHPEVSGPLESQGTPEASDEKLDLRTCHAVGCNCAYCGDRDGSKAEANRAAQAMSADTERLRWLLREALVCAEWARATECPGAEEVVELIRAALHPISSD